MRNNVLVVLIFCIFFAISFLTNILGSINPNVSDSYTLSGTTTGLLPFSFFIAYAVMSIPSGMFVQKYGEKRALIYAWILALIGSLCFSLAPTFPIFLGSLFLIGCGMALLQVTVFPLLRIAGGEEHFAFNSVFAQLVFGAASFLSPFVYAYLVIQLGKPDSEQDVIVSLLAGVTPDNLSWVSIYWVFSLVSFVMLALIALTRIPTVVRKEDEVVGAWDTHLNLFKQKQVILFFLGIFAYVGVEQGIANWISEFLRTYHGFSPEVEGASTVGLFWGLMTVGCILGLGLLKIMDSRLVLKIFTAASILILGATLFGDATLALIGFPALGFCFSVMYGIIFSLGLNSVTKYHGSFSGILCTGIAGGAIFSLLVGQLKDLFDLQTGLAVLFIPFIYILSIGFWAKPLINNATLSGNKSS